MLASHERALSDIVDDELVRGSTIIARLREHATGVVAADGGDLAVPPHLALTDEQLAALARVPRREGGLALDAQRLDGRQPQASPRRAERGEGRHERYHHGDRQEHRSRRTDTDSGGLNTPTDINEPTIRPIES